MSLATYRTACLRAGNQLFTFRSFSISLSETHFAIQQMCKRYSESELKPCAAQLDAEGKFPLEQIKKMGDMGLLAVNVSQKWGGSGYDRLALSLAVEEIAKGCGSTGAIMSITNTLYVNLIDRCGTDKQKHEFLKPFTRDVGCFALSEPDAGSDVSAMATTAKLVGDYYVLNGIKSWVTSGLEAKSAVIFATIDKGLKHKGITAFLVPLPIEGLQLGKNEDKLGIRATSTCTFTLEDVKVPKENVLGNIGGGFKIAMEQLDEGRLGIASQALGIGQAALETALNYAEHRKTFGYPINRLDAVKLRITEMALRLESARLLVWRAAVLRDKNQKSTKESSMAKLAASEAATFITHNAVQILGGMGYVKSMPAERHFRDARITEIYGGVSDVQKLIIADAIIKEYR